MITVYAQLLAKRCDGLLDEDSAVFVGNIVDGATRMRDLLTDLLAYTDLAARPDGPTESKAVVTSDSLPILSAHPSHFIPLFQNLVVNAMKYRCECPPRIHISFVDGVGKRPAAE